MVGKDGQVIVHLFLCLEIAYFWAEVFWLRAKSQAEKRRVAVGVRGQLPVAWVLLSEMLYREGVSWDCMSRVTWDHSGSPLVGVWV